MRIKGTAHFVVRIIRDKVIFDTHLTQSVNKIDCESERSIEI